MRHINPIKTSIAVGSVVALWHLVWVMLVGLGWAKKVLDFVLQLHFLDLRYSLLPYSATTGATLVLLTFVLGACFGLVFAVLWNWLSYESAPTWAKDRSSAAAE